MRGIIKFKSIKFYNYSFNYIFRSLIKKGGYLVAPAASSLCDIFRSKIYYNSLIYSNVAILDSGFFCLLLRIFKKNKVEKLSGYLFLSLFLERNEIKEKKIFLIDPNKYEQKKNINYFRKCGFKYCNSMTVPKYNYANYKDKKLLNKIKNYKPDFVILNIGGGIQEPIGLYLYQNLKINNKKIIIICTGAAISFLTRVQAPITKFYDKIYLGWLIRLIHRPKNYLPRILKSFELIKYF
tara:strand:+ start:98 stop:811 length:714 start_codon:yes stop_codon:yes gene_type:complete